MSDVVERAKAALEGVTEGPWVFDPERDDYLVSESTGEVVGSHRFNTQFIAAARTLVPELVAEVERLRTFVDVVQSLSDVCPVCLFLLNECECGVRRS